MAWLIILIASASFSIFVAPVFGAAAKQRTDAGTTKPANGSTTSTPVSHAFRIHVKHQLDDPQTGQNESLAFSLAHHFDKDFMEILRNGKEIVDKPLKRGAALTLTKKDLTEGQYQVIAFAMDSKTHEASLATCRFNWYV